MNDGQLNSADIIKKYKVDIIKMTQYLSWLQAKDSEKLISFYGDEDLKTTTLAVPVFDSTLLRFVREARATQLMDSNYAYVYSKFHIRDYREEWKLIENCKIHDIYILKGILSKYILKGMTKGAFWSQGIEYSIFLKVVSKLKELVEFFDGEELNGR